MHVTLVWLLQHWASLLFHTLPITSQQEPAVLVLQSLKDCHLALTVHLLPFPVVLNQNHDVILSLHLIIPQAYLSFLLLFVCPSVAFLPTGPGRFFHCIQCIRIGSFSVNISYEIIREWRKSAFWFGTDHSFSCDHNSSLVVVTRIRKWSISAFRFSLENLFLFAMIPPLSGEWYIDHVQQLQQFCSATQICQEPSMTLTSRNVWNNTFSEFLDKSLVVWDYFSSYFILIPILAILESLLT